MLVQDAKSVGDAFRHLYCDRIVMLADGRCHAVGPPARVLTAENIAHVYGSQVHVLTHPQSGTPVVLPAPNGHTRPERNADRI